MRRIPTHNKPPASKRCRHLALALMAAGLCHPLLLPSPIASAQPASPLAPAGGAASAVTPVGAVDLERFVGTWYEVARIPAWFQNRCFKDTTARYELRSDGRITVINRCVTRKGETDQDKVWRGSSIHSPNPGCR